MGIQDKGAFGGFRNKTGPLVGHIVNGQNVITSIPRKSTKLPTLKQRDQRKKFGLVTSYLSWISGLIEIGFQDHEARQSAMNKAVQYNLLNAVTGVSPDFAIAYSKLVYSQGKCPLPGDTLIEGLLGEKVDYSWGITLPSKYGKQTDMATLMVYNPDKDRFVVLQNAAARSQLGFTLQLPADFLGDTIHCYLSFVAQDGKLVSNSTYIGLLIVI
jgi:hypothetical protein